MNEELWLIYQAQKRRRPVCGDSPFVKPFSITIESGNHDFVTVEAGKNKMLFLRELWFSYEDETKYALFKDAGRLVFDALDFNIQPIRFEPPVVAKNKFTLKIENNDSVAHTYKICFIGWKRPI